MKNSISSMQIIRLALFGSYIQPLSILQLQPQQHVLWKEKLLSCAQASSSPDSDCSTRELQQFPEDVQDGLYVVTFCEYHRLLQPAGWMWLFTTMKNTVTLHSSALYERANPIRPKPNSQTSTAALGGKCGSEVCCQNLFLL